MPTFHIILSAIATAGASVNIEADSLTEALGKSRQLTLADAEWTCHEIVEGTIKTVFFKEIK